MKSNLFFIFSCSCLFNFSYSQNNEKNFFKKSNDSETKSSFFKAKNKVDLNTNELSKITKVSVVNKIKKDSIIDLKTETAADTTFIEKKKIDFLKSPLVKGKITSVYSKHRFHPVLKKWSEHKGTDFAAAYGTSIKATAGGIVEKTGYTSANGNFVKIKHNATYSTQYLHMSKILVDKGEKIKIGQEIGLVGDSGYATGPHVCYRFWKNGIQVDPFSLDFSKEEKENNIKSEAVAVDVTEEENEKEFKTFVSGFFKKKTDEN